MDIKRGKEELTVIEAVDNLSNMAEIDIKSYDPDTFLQKIEGEINWKDPRQALANEPLLKETFRVIHRYLQNIVRKDQNSLKDSNVQKGIQAIMLLATEAADKMDHFSALYPKEYNTVSKLKEYTDLQKYYAQQILHQMPKPKEVPEDWEGDVEQTDWEMLQAHKRGLRDMESVRRDLNYELFFIKNENGKPYFHKSLLRHIRLVGNFDELISTTEGDDPLLHMRELLDREIHEGAKEALEQAMPYIDEFYKEGMQHKERPYIGGLNKAVMALRMAANPKNLIENQSFKSCLEYYADFHRFLREALDAPGYKERVSTNPTDPFSLNLLSLTHALCCFYFMRKEPIQEALTLMDKMDKQGDAMRGPRPAVKVEEKKLQIWTDLREKDDNIRFLLKHYPNGPILRTLDAFREEEEFEGFDPLTHYNFPSQVFSFFGEDFHITLLRLPCPTKQEYIHKAEVVDEFEGFLRFYAHELKPDKHLLINLQDRTSWEAFARCRALEEHAKKAEYAKTHFGLGLALDGDFYSQTGQYAQVSGAPVFLEQLKEQLMSGRDCGFHYPEELKKGMIEDSIDPLLSFVHEVFFKGKTALKRMERQIFIDIFYLLFSLKIAELLKVDSISFTCKDGLDKGPCMTASLYGFLKMLENPKKWTEKEIGNLTWMLYSPALLVRDRAVLEPRLKRALALLEHTQRVLFEDSKEVGKRLKKIFTILKFPTKIDVAHLE